MAGSLTKAQIRDRLTRALMAEALKIREELGAVVHDGTVWAEGEGHRLLFPDWNNTPEGDAPTSEQVLVTIVAFEPKPEGV